MKHPQRDQAKVIVVALAATQSPIALYGGIAFTLMALYLALVF